MDRLIAPFREFGWFAGLIYALDRLLGRLSSRARLYYYEMMVQPVSDKPLLPQRLAKSFEFREIGRGQAEVAQMPALDATKEARFEQGAKCLAAYKKGRLIGYLWLCFGQYEEDEVRCTYQLSPPEQSVFDFDLYLFPEHRMGVGFAAIWHGANAFLSRSGIRYTFSRLTRFNIASRRAHDHLGWKRVGSAIFLQVGTLEIMVGSIAPFVHISVRSSARVRLTLVPNALHH